MADTQTELNKIATKADLENEDDELFRELENDDIPNSIREARLNELKLKARENQFIQANKNEIYKELSEEEFLNLTTKTSKCIVHFYHYDFRRCDIMHGHMLKIAEKYDHVRVAKINVEKAKFFVKKLNIQVLPAVLCFSDGVLKNRIVGFDQLGNNDNFQTRELEKLLWKLKFLKRPDNEEVSDESDDEGGEKKKRSLFRQTDQNRDHSDSD